MTTTTPIIFVFRHVEWGSIFKILTNLLA